MSPDGSTKIGFQNSGVQWETQIAKWAGEENDWNQRMKQTQPREEDAVHHLLLSVRQATRKKARKPGRTVSSKKKKNQGNWLHLNLVHRTETRNWPWKSRKTIVDWVSGHAKLKKMEWYYFKRPEPNDGVVEARS